MLRQVHLLSTNIENGNDIVQEGVPQDIEIAAAGCDTDQAITSVGIDGVRVIIDEILSAYSENLAANLATEVGRGSVARDLVDTVVGVIFRFRVVTSNNRLNEP